MKKTFSIAHYMGIAETPLVILLNRNIGSFSKQFDTVEELQKELGDDVVIYFVANEDDKRIDGLDNWHGGKFDFNKLSTHIN